MNLRNLSMVSLAYGLLMGGGCLQAGCSVASRAKWQSSADHTGQALEHAGGAIADGGAALVLDVAWIGGQMQDAWGLIPVLGDFKLLGEAVTP